MNEFTQKLLSLDNAMALTGVVIDYDIISGEHRYVVVNRVNGKKVVTEKHSNSFIALAVHAGIVMSGLSEHYEFIADVFCHMVILRINRKNCTEWYE